MNKAKIAAAGVLALSLAGGMGAAAQAEWRPSQAQQGATLAESGHAVIAADGTVTEVDAASGVLIVTNVAQTLAAVETFNTENPGLAYAEKADRTMANGLQYAANQQMNIVYRAALAASGTRELVEKFTADAQALPAIEAQIAANQEVARARLAAQLAERQAAGDAQGAAAAERQLAALDEAAYVALDRYVPMALFDVTAAGTAAEAVASGGRVEMTVNVDGAVPESDLLALHFTGEVTDGDAVIEALAADPAAVVAEMGIAVLPCTAGEGTVTLTMTSFSPVMILTRAETAPEAATAESAAPQSGGQAPGAAGESAGPAEPSRDGGLAPWLFAGAGAAAAALGGGIYAVHRKRKTKPASKKP